MPMNGVIKEGRWTVCLLFQDLEKGESRYVYPQGMSAEEVMALIADPAKQFAPVPPAPPPPAYP